MVSQKRMKVSLQLEEYSIYSERNDQLPEWRLYTHGTWEKDICLRNKKKIGKIFKDKNQNNT